MVENFKTFQRNLGENLTFVEAINEIKTDFNFLLPTTSSPVEVTTSEYSPTTLETTKDTNYLSDDLIFESTIVYESTAETTFDSTLEPTTKKTVFKIKENTTRKNSLNAGSDLKTSGFGVIYSSVICVFILVVAAPIIFVIRKRRNASKEISVDRQVIETFFL